MSPHNGTETLLCVIRVCRVGGVALAATPRLIGKGPTSLWNPLEPGHMSAGPESVTHALCTETSRTKRTR